MHILPGAKTLLAVSLEKRVSTNPCGKHTDLSQVLLTLGPKESQTDYLQDWGLEFPRTCRHHWPQRIGMQGNLEALWQVQEGSNREGIEDNMHQVLGSVLSLSS